MKKFQPSGQTVARAGRRCILINSFICTALRKSPDHAASKTIPRRNLLLIALAFFGRRAEQGLWWGIGSAAGVHCPFPAILLPPRKAQPRMLASAGHRQRILSGVSIRGLVLFKVLPSASGPMILAVAVTAVVASNPDRGGPTTKSSRHHRTSSSRFRN